MGKGSENTPLWARALAPHPLRNLGHDAPEAGCEWFGPRKPAAGQTPEVSGLAYGDGSRRGPAGLGATGWGYAVVGPRGQLRFGAFGPVPAPRPWQDVLLAELTAFLELTRWAVLPLEIGMDNSVVIKGLRKGKRWSCSAKKGARGPLEGNLGSDRRHNARLPI